jgi:hypothetical protein
MNECPLDRKRSHIDQPVCFGKSLNVSNDFVLGNRSKRILDSEIRQHEIMFLLKH